MSTTLLDDLEARGLVQDTTDRQQLAARLAAGPIGLYYGCDPTADSLHVGNLIGLLVLRRFQDAGHRPVALAGGATGMVGDPSGQFRRAQPARRRDPRSPTWPRSRPRWRASSTSRTGGCAARGQPRLDRGRHACSTSCGTLASTSPSTRCWPGSRCGPASPASRASATPSSATCCCRRTTTCGCNQHLGRRAADRRVRPVGQHPLGHRPRAAGAGAGGPRPVVAAAHRARRLEAGQDHRGPDLARSSQDEPVPVLPALDADGRPRRSGSILAKFTLLRCRVPSTNWQPSMRRRPSAARAKRRWRVRSPSWCTVRGPRGPRNRHRRCCSAAIAARRPVATHWRWWRRRCPPRRCGSDEDLAAGIDLVPLLAEAGLASSKRRRPALPGAGRSVGQR